MASYRFLSPEWIVAARKVYEECDGIEGTDPAPIAMNLLVEDVPFDGDGELEAHLDTRSGTTVIDVGHLEDAEVKVSLGYETAKALFVGGDAEAGLRAFMEGRIRVEGDMTKLLSYQSGPTGEREAAIGEGLRAITE